MLIRKVRIQLIAFVVIAAVAVVYALLRFTDLEESFGGGGYTVELHLRESGGIFTSAEVTYRGYNIGRVGRLSLTDSGLKAQLNIEPEAPPIPRELHAVVANRSAVGEQYVDLRPVTENGPYLENGSVIHAESTSTPIPTQEVIKDLDRLAGSVPTDALRTVVDESYNAFRGTGDDLQKLMDTTREFTRVAQQYLPQTVQLLEQGNTVLDTQNDMAGSLRSFSSDLRALSDTLKSSDGDIRRLIQSTPKATEQVRAFLAESGPGLGTVIANLLTTSNILVTRQDGLEQMLVTYPAVSAGAFSVVPGDGYAHLGLVLNVFNPMACTKGYRDPETYRTGGQTSVRQPNWNAYCAEPPGSPISVRGAQNAPYGGEPVQPSEAQVEEHSDRNSEQAAALAGQSRQSGLPGVAGAPGLGITSLAKLMGL